MSFGDIWGCNCCLGGHDLRRWLNHLFQHCVTGEVSEYKNIEETFSPEVISRMISWLKAL